MTNHLLVIGTINMDLVAKVPGFPRPGETIASNYYVESLGGKAANQAIAAKRSGAEVSFIGKVGGDSFGREAYKQLIEEGINVEYLMQSDKKSTGTSLIVVNEDGENMIITNLQANTDLSINEVEHSLLALENVEAALLQLEMSSEMISTIIATLKKRQIPIFVNLAPVIPISLETQSLIDVLILNEVEASQLSGIHVHDKKTAEQSAFLIKKHINQKIIVTLGAKGVLVYHKNEFYYYRAPQVKALDSTAAGDCFCGVLVTHWLKHKDILKAVQTAIHAASLSVTRYGAKDSLPFEEEIDVFTRKTSEQNNYY